MRVAGLPGRSSALFDVRSSPTKKETMSVGPWRPPSRWSSMVSTPECPKVRPSATAPRQPNSEGFLKMKRPEGVASLTGTRWAGVKSSTMDRHVLVTRLWWLTVLLTCARARKSATIASCRYGLAVSLSVAAVGLILAFLMIGRQRSPHLNELGPISTRWLSEHETHSHDSER